jgi:hypothetical protein
MQRTAKDTPLNVGIPDMTHEEYEQLRAPLLRALAEANEQYRLNTAPIHDQLLRLSAKMQADLNKPGNIGHWTTPSVPDAHGLTQAELACAPITAPGTNTVPHPFCGYDTGCPFCG